MPAPIELREVRARLEELARSCTAVDTAHPITIEAEGVTKEAIVLTVSMRSVHMTDACDQFAWAVARTMPGFTMTIVDG